MTERETENRAWLHTRWLALAGRCSADMVAADTVWNALVRHYCEPHRAYHNLSHIMALLRLADEERAHSKCLEVVELAIWFHDVIYDTRTKDNEQQSAAWALDAMTAMRIDETLIAPVEQCILATHKHDMTASHADDLPLFLDLDLSILGASTPVYRRYSEAIRIEYGWVPDAIYRAGRAELLQRFLDRSALFFTAAIAERYENAARHNIGLELQELRQQT